VAGEYDLGALPSGGSPGSGLAVAGQNVFVASSATGIHVLRAFQDESDPAGNAGRSLPVDTTDDVILAARLTAVETPGVSWEISADAGLNWQDIDSGTGWSPLAIPGTDLVWRSSHTWQGQNPTVDEVALDWLYQYGPITAITDVPDDQGGWVRLGLNRSGLDAVDEASTPVTGYQIYQRVDAAVLAAAAGDPAGDDPALTEDAARIMASFGSAAVRTAGDRTFVVGSSVDKAVGFPAGTWEAVGWVAATQSDTYTARVPTVADSTTAGTTWSVYLVTTHTITPSIWFASAPDSSYSVDNIAPGVPLGFATNTAAGAVSLDWFDSPEADFQFYRIYRDTDPGFVPSPATLLTETATSDLVDATPTPWDYHYKVSAVDHAGNESPAASPEATSDVGDTPLAGRVALNEAVPNPFNPSTVLAFSLPATMQARLTIHDVSGRIVRVLADGVMAAGRHEFTWDGSDHHSRRVASGVYFFSLEAGATAETRRMVMVK
jgi:hypothetical protein